MSELAIRSDRRGRRTSVEPELIRRHRPDYLLVIFILVLMMLSVIVMYSIWPALLRTYGNHFVGQQIVYLLLGLIVFFGVSRVPLKLIENLATFFLITAILASLLLSGLSMIPSTPLVACINGACSWFDLGFVTFQPVEYVKFALTVYVGVFLAARLRDGTLQDKSRTMWPFTFIILVTLALIVGLQSDLGSGFILLSMLMAMAFVAGLPWKHLFAVVGIIGAAGALAIIVQPYRMERIAVYFGSGATDASSYHSEQALIAIGSGGFFGKGLAGGVQAYGYLPETINDSIFAVMAEMFGFVGSLAILLILGGLIYRLVVLIDRSQRPEFRIIAAGLATWIAMHTFVNVGSMLGVIPITGVTLPLLSYGGSNLIFTMAAMGLAFSMSKYTSHSKVGDKNERETANYENSMRGRRFRGHVAPVVAVINELKASNKNLQVWFVTERGFAPQAKNIMKRADADVNVKLIWAGKIRRYSGIPLWRQLLHIPTQLYNLRDLFLLTVGFVGSLLFLLRVRPDVVFTKGGFVCVPVGLAAKILNIPLVVHDSDTHPGLTNRLLARWAAGIATGAPLEYYNYPKEISHYVGIPIDNAYHPATAVAQKRLKHKLGYPEDKPLVLVTGGGLGSRRINELMAATYKTMEIPAQIVHISGTGHYETVKKAVGENENYEVIAFVDELLPDLVRAADVVVARAGATTLLELAAAAKTAVIIPHPNLPGNHQTKNARVYNQANAAVVLTELELQDQPELLVQTLDWLLQDDEVRRQLSTNINQFAKPKAAREMAKIIRGASKNKRAGKR